MPTPTHTEGPETGPGDARPRPARGMGVERLALILVALAGVLSLASYRFHLGVRTYDTFVIKQVIPSSGLQGWLTRTFGYDPSAYDEQARATLGSPYYPEFFRADPLHPDETASDYLQIWYYTREVLSGRDPYVNSQGFIFVSHGIYSNEHYKKSGYCGMTEEYDPGLPDQASGCLMYPPMGPLLILPFYLPNYFASLALYLAAVHALAAVLACLMVRASPGYRLPASLLALTLFLTSYPLGLLVDRGNIEGVVLILTGLGLLLYARGRHLMAAALFGLAASGKVVPAVFLALFLLDGRFKALLVAVAVGAGATVLAMLAMHEPPATLVSEMLRNQSLTKNELMSGNFPRHFAHSFFALLQGGLFSYFPAGRAAHLSARLSPFYSAGILASTGAILLLLRRVPFVNRVLVLTVMMLAFPQMSYDYKLIHLYIPFGMIFVGAVRRGWASPVEVATLVMLGVVFSPKAYQFGPYSFGYYINGVLLGVLIVVGLMARLGGPGPGGVPDAGEPDVGAAVRA